MKIWKDKGLFEREVRYYQELAARGTQVTLITWGDSEDSLIANEIPTIKVIPVYTRMICPKNKVLRALVSVLAPFYLREEIKAAEILKTNQMWGAWVAVISKILFTKPLILRSGFELFKFACLENQNLVRRCFIWALSYISYTFSNRIYLATDEDEAFVKKHFFASSDKISVRPNWIDTDVFTRREVDQKQGHILYVGRLSKQKNLYVLIDALAGLGYTLDIIGTGEIKEPLKEFAKKLKVKVNFLGSVPNSKLPTIYNAYPLYVLPSKYEGNPKTLLEAMASGCAVLGADVPGIRSIIRHEENGLLCAPDAASFKAAIKRLMKDDALRLALGEAARADVMTTNALESIISLELDDYKTLIKANAHG